MLSKSENEVLTRVGPGTPCGELLRRYWHPIEFVKALDERPKRKRLLGENLVLFRGGDGRTGLLGLHCSHRGVSLEYGRAERAGLRCPYHGWLYDVEGRCLEQPAEPHQSTFKDRIRQKAYRTAELGAIIWAYMGPEPAPLLPNWDVLVREDGVRCMNGRTINCNFFQASEGNVDATHVQYLHKDVFVMPSDKPGRPFWKLNEYGISNNLVCGVPEGFSDTYTSYFIMPNANRFLNHYKREADQYSYEAMGWRVPIDDTRHFKIYVAFIPFDQIQGRSGMPLQVPDAQEKGIQEARNGYEWDEATGWIAAKDQDTMAQESQGEIYDRTCEHLGASDEGLIMLRSLFFASIGLVRQGDDPYGIIRDESRNRCLSLPTSVAGRPLRRPSAAAPLGA
jgi:5,5'-dehydrodivanillate O-demethylase